MECIHEVISSQDLLPVPAFSWRVGRCDDQLILVVDTTEGAQKYFCVLAGGWIECFCFRKSVKYLTLAETAEVVRKHFRVCRESLREGLMQHKHGGFSHLYTAGAAILQSFLWSWLD